MFLYQTNFNFSTPILELVYSYRFENGFRSGLNLRNFEEVSYTIFNSKIISLFYNNGKILHWSKQNSSSLYLNRVKEFSELKYQFKDFINYINSILKNTNTEYIMSDFIKIVPLTCLITSPHKEFRDFYKNEIYIKLEYDKLEYDKLEYDKLKEIDHINF